MKNFTDEQLIKNYLKGNEKALEELVQRYLPLIYNFSRRYAGNPDNASDISQEVFVKVWKNLRKFDASKNFKNWILAIAKNTALDWLKKRDAVPVSLLKEYQEDEEFLENITDPNQISIIDQIYRESVSRDVSLAIKKLPLKYSAVLNFRHDDGFNFREIAEILNEPLNTVKSRYRRGLALLRKFLNPAK
jgi:RNA polymerase sigma-70 factor (ECF subfamily)